MPERRAEIHTKFASRSLQQLCQHWGHKFAVDFTPHTARSLCRWAVACSTPTRNSSWSSFHPLTLQVFPGSRTSWRSI
jgi:Uncharacterized protein conserved in bacteria (DUF2218)